jgi:hypothetical protein
MPCCMAPKTVKCNNSKHICLALSNPKCQNNMLDVLKHHALRLVCEADSSVTAFGSKWPELLGVCMFFVFSTCGACVPQHTCHHHTIYSSTTLAPATPTTSTSTITTTSPTTLTQPTTNNINNNTNTPNRNINSKTNVASTHQRVKHNDGTTNLQLC